MNRALYAALLLFGIPAVLQAAEQDLRPRFERVRAVEESFTAGRQGRLTVPDDVFGQSRDFPNDVRILGDDGIQWPFFLHLPKDTVETEVWEPEILNRAFVSGRESHLQFDVAVPQKNGGPSVHNQLELTTSGHDFIRRVEVFTSGEPPARGLMSVGYLIDFSGRQSAQNRIIRYPSSDESRLHVRIYANARDAEETFNLISVKLRCRTAADVDRETVDAVEMEVPDREKETVAQTHMFDLDEVNRPVERIKIKTQTPSFARSVSVYGRNSDHEPWSRVGGGEIHVLEGDTQEQINVRARHRFIKIHIFHYDDQPLAVNSIQMEALPRYLVFEAASAGHAGLYYRGWDLKPPRYDLKERIETRAMAELPLYALAEPVANEHVKTHVWRKYSKGLGMLAVAVVSVLVIGIIASMIRQQKRQSPAE
jgi:hypothetical protein